MIFFYYSHFTFFGSFGIFAKDSNFIIGTPQTYTDTDTHTCTHAHVQAHPDTHTYRYRHAHTHTDVHVRNLRKFYFKPNFKLKWAKIVTLSGKSEVTFTSDPLLSFKQEI